MSAGPSICKSCGALLDGDVSACPYCEHRSTPEPAQGWGRALGFVAPQWCPVTHLLIGANIAHLLVVMILFGGQQLFKPTSEALLAMGALNPYLFNAGEYWRLVTYGFVHVGAMHIAFNMLALSQVGTALEDAMGGARLFVVYLLSLVGGGVADLIWRGNAIINIAGASGALFGLIGFGMSFAHFHGGPLGHAQRKFFLHWAVYGFAFGYLVNADNICHLGGFIVGALMGYPVEREQRAGRNFTWAWRTASALLLATTVAAFVWMSL